MCILGQKHLDLCHLHLGLQTFTAFISVWKQLACVSMRNLRFYSAINLIVIGQAGLTQTWPRSTHFDVACCSRLRLLTDQA